MAPTAPAHRTVVKVCGITRLEDASAALDAGADWLGFVFYPESPRRIEAESAARILAALPHATGVLVMVSPEPEEALALARRIGARRLQLHRVEPSEWPHDFPLPLTVSIPVGEDGQP